MPIGQVSSRRLPGDVGEIIFEVESSALDGLNDPLRQDEERRLDVLDVAADPRVAGDEDKPTRR